MNDRRLEHVCHWHYVSGSLNGVKPNGAKYRKYEFTVQCTKCGVSKLVKSTSKAQAEDERAKYPPMPDFPK